MKKYHVLNYLIRTGPGRTELELARAIHGETAYEQAVAQHCVMLVIEGKAQRRGRGGPGDRIGIGRLNTQWRSNGMKQPLYARPPH